MYQHWRILLLFLELVVFERIRSFIYPFLFPQLLIIAPLGEEAMEEYILNHPKMRALFEESYEEYKQYGY